jgi:hypothetical protein
METEVKVNWQRVEKHQTKVMARMKWLCVACFVIYGTGLVLACDVMREHSGEAGFWVFWGYTLVATVAGFFGWLAGSNAQAKCRANGWGDWWD